MSKILNTLSAIGALVMAATPLIAVGGVAHAAETAGRPVHILVADLNLGHAADAAIFRQRVDAAAETICTRRGEMGLDRLSACRQAVREEAVERLGEQQRQDLRSAQTTGRNAWTVAAR